MWPYINNSKTHTSISVLFSKIKHLSEELEDVRNVVVIKV